MAAAASDAAVRTSPKTIVTAIEASLRRLQTDHIDLYWVHARDLLTPVEEPCQREDAGPVRDAGGNVIDTADV